MLPRHDSSNTLTYEKSAIKGRQHGNMKILQQTIQPPPVHIRWSSVSFSDSMMFCPSKMKCCEKFWSALPSRFSNLVCHQSEIRSSLPSCLCLSRNTVCDPVACIDKVLLTHDDACVSLGSDFWIGNQPLGAVVATVLCAMRCCMARLFDTS